MAEISYGVTNTDGNVRIVSWPTMANGDTGQPYVAPHFHDASVHAYGTPGAGLNVRIQGTNEVAAAPSNWATLNDATQTALNMSSLPILRQILENPYQVRPNITAGDGTTSVTVVILFMHGVPRWRAQE